MTSASIIRLACVAVASMLLTGCASDEPATTSTTTTSRTSTVEPAMPVPATSSTTTTVTR